MANLSYLVYLLLKKPIFEGYRIEVFNEVCNLACSVMLFMFTDFVEDGKLKYEIGFCFIGIYILNFLVNLTIVIVEKGRSIFLRLKFLYLKLKYMRLVKTAIAEMMKSPKAKYREG